MGLDCLNTIVGLSDDDCQCYDDDRPTVPPYNQSDSGLYISDLVPLRFTNSAADCEQGGAWDILQKSRKRAITDFLRDYSNMVTKVKSYKYEPFSGIIGAERFNNSLNFMAATKVTGVKVCPAYIKDGQFILTGIKLALDNLNLPSQDIEVFVYSNRDLSTPISSTIVTLTQNNKFFSASFASPVVMDLGDKDEDLEFYIVYENTLGLRYVNNKNLEGCGCGGSRYTTNPFLHFIDVDGIEAATFEDLDSNALAADGNMRGLRLEGYTTCNVFNWLCRLSVNPQDLAANLTAGNDVNLGMQMADAINHKAAFYAGEKVLSSTNVNRMTLVAPEILNENLTKWEEKYDSYLKYFVHNIPDYVNDCFTCKIDRNISINSIIV